ncbi:adenine nucleotide alpha hydrolase [Scheffersomyces amazonensis]|uniref:adenine nucleotide alpha hydrolase n=1 Tax=Scheffersomyces amazonensis TaxID=1078765 RepID=UPI00315C5F7E
MKFVALISGGKDSFFNIHHCLSQGHDLIALANLYPQDPTKDEIDSFMFQTVGHDVIEYYSGCLNVPLYRQPISGTSSNQHLEYSITKDDEIEDLYKLLSTVKHHHPDLQAVSCGAILSHYQRSRVENVCDRLNLTSLAYLWQRDQYELMQEMCQNQLDARLIKVAAIGLNENHLGKSISQVFSQLVKLNQLYEVHICGEGGEFETLVFDSPIFKYKKLILTDKQIVNHSNDDVSYLKVKVEVEEKDDASDYSLINPPDLLSPEFDELLDEVKRAPDLSKLDINETAETVDASIRHKSIESIVSTETKLYISNITSSAPDLKNQATEIFHRLAEILQEHNLSFNNIQHITLLLADMSSFNEINSIYSKSFEHLYLPPSRICIQTSLNSQIQLSCIVLKQHPDNMKSGHHIRSRSYWAPQNIGPYSQTVIETRGSYKTATLSGQIPLIPSSMELSLENSEFNSVLSLQHLHRVKTLANVTKLASVICFITRQRFLSEVSSTWNEYISSIEQTGSSLKQLVIVQVPALPRNAQVEWGGLSYESITDMYYDDDDDMDVDNKESDITKLVETFEDSNYVCIDKAETFKVVVLFSNEQEIVKELLKTNQSDYIQLITTHTHAKELNITLNCEFLPVDAVWNNKGKSYKYALVLKIESKLP